jgi:hypothetical protein
MIRIVITDYQVNSNNVMNAIVSRVHDLNITDTNTYRPEK